MHRWLPRTTFDGLVTAAYWSFAGMTVDSSRDRWARGTAGGLGIVPVAPTVTFGGQTIYFETINTAQVGLNLDDGPSPRQPRIAVTNVASLEWEQVAWSREVWIENYETSTGRGCEKMGLAPSENRENLRKMVVAKVPVPIFSLPRMAKLTTGYDGYLVYPHYRHHPEILQPLEHTTVRVKVELAEPVPDGMVGTLHREAVTKLAGETYGRRFRQGQRPAPNSETRAERETPSSQYSWILVQAALEGSTLGQFPHDVGHGRVLDAGPVEQLGHTDPVALVVAWAVIREMDLVETGVCFGELAR